MRTVTLVALIGCAGEEPEVTDPTDPTRPALATWYADADGDGFGDPDVAIEAAEAPAGHVDNAEDCDDADPDVHPGQTERCDGVDDDCDATTTSTGVGFLADDGTWTDQTSAFAGGTPTRPVEFATTGSGELVICEAEVHARVLSTHDLVVTGAAGPQGAAISVDALADPIVTATGGSLVLQGLALSGGRSGVIAEGAAVTIRGVEISGTQTSGAGVGVSGGSLDAEDLVVHDAFCSRGCVVVEDGATASLVRATVRDNGTGSYGGILVNDSTLSLQDSTLSGNTGNPLSFGGGIAVVGSSTVTVERSTISGNETAAGGGIYTEGGSDITLTDTLVRDNDAGEGGGLYSELRLPNAQNTATGNITCQSTTPGAGGFLGNHALQGGAVLLHVYTASNVRGPTDEIGDHLETFDCSFGVDLTSEDNTPEDVVVAGTHDECVVVDCVRSHNDVDYDFDDPKWVCLGVGCAN